MSDLGLTDLQKQHVTLMRVIARSLADTPMVLKGGTSLLLCYHLNRFSEDLDFDSSIKLNLQNRIIQAVQPINDITLDSISLVKNTDTTQRVKTVFTTPHGIIRLKIETSLRDDPDLNLVTQIDGIRVYQLEAIISQKISALKNRTASRDLHDVHFLIRSYSERFQDAHIAALADFLKSPDEVEHRFRPAYEDDYLLPEEDLEQTLLELIEAVEQKQVKCG